MSGISGQGGSAPPDGQPTDEQGAEHLAHEVEDFFTHDIEIERESLEASIQHDYSTGVVPLDKRRPLGHFIALWTTFAAGYSFLFVGTAVHDAGYTLPATIGITVLAVGIYFVYWVFGCYLGSRTGQTMTLLTRSIFGSLGSIIVSVLIVIGATGWTGFQANLMVTVWHGLYGWGAIEALTIIFAGVMVFNNLFGFTGISVFARYVVAPVIMLWVAYLVIRGLIDHSALLSHHPKNVSGLHFWQVFGAILGFVVWGNEPDVFRYGKPKFLWPIPAYVVATCVGFLLFVVGGWMMAQFSGSSSFGSVIRYATNFSLFGAFWLSFILVTISQFALNDGNYYEAINAMQNIFGNLKVWKRVYSCLFCAALGALSGYLVNYVLTNGFLKVAAFLAVTAPTATLILATDHFVLPRLFGISRPLLKVPKWTALSIGNWPAIVALAVAVVFGAWATGIFPGENSSRYWVLAPLLTWLLGVGLYIVLVWITKLAVPNDKALKELLGFSKVVEDTPLPSREVADIASVAEGKVRPPEPVMAGAAPDGS